MYSKLFSSICLSSIWSEDSDTRVLWITMLAQCDREGYLYASPVGLAKVASLPLETTLACLEKLAAPDPHSSDLLENPANEGRRIKTVPGGWLLVNYVRYRQIRDSDDRRRQNREAQARFRNREAAKPWPFKKKADGNAVSGNKRK